MKPKPFEIIVEFTPQCTKTGITYETHQKGLLIRCKDCKYWLPHSQFGFDEDNDEYYDYCELLVPDDDYYAITRQADDYCSRAERKEE